MKYRRLGQSGLRVSAIGLGTWLTFGGRVDLNKATELVTRALDVGINFIDTADVYAMGKAEDILGSSLAGIPRKDFVLASKVFFPTGPGPNDKGLSRKHIDETVHASLSRLRTNYIDLYQCHRYDEETPLQETVRAFDDLIRQGKILYWGVSAWTAEQIEEAVSVADQMGAPRPVSNQPVYSLMKREIEDDVLPTCGKHGLGILPYSPLAQGVLTGKYVSGERPDGTRAADERESKFMDPYFGEKQDAQVKRLVEMAGDCGLRPAQLSLARLLRRPEVSSVIAGATKVRQVEENAAAADADVPAEVLAELDAVFG